MRHLTPEEIAAYDVVDAALAAKVRIVRVPILPPGASGMTVGRFILLRSDLNQRGTRQLIAHELVHVRQFEEQGFARFLWTYLRDYLRQLRVHRRHRAAYLAIPAEVEARAEADTWKLRAR